MNDFININKPKVLEEIAKDAENINFKMSCDILTGSFLRTFASIKSFKRILELGTGVGISTAWILDGMQEDALLLSVEKEEELQDIARKHLGVDTRVKFILIDGGEFIESNKNERFDFIFADTWPGKYYLLDEALEMLNYGGMFLVDDLSIVDSWPDEHKLKVENLINYLEKREDLLITKFSWSTGLIVVTKRNISWG